MHRGEQRPQGRRRGGYQYAAFAFEAAHLNKHEAAIWSEVLNATDPQHSSGVKLHCLPPTALPLRISAIYSARIGAEGDRAAITNTGSKTRDW